MYCSECGCEVNGKFCSNCGTRVQLGEVPEVFDWRQSYDFERITQSAEVNQRVTQAKAGAGRDTSSLLLDLIDAVASPMMGESQASRSPKPRNLSQRNLASRRGKNAGSS